MPKFVDFDSNRNRCFWARRYLDRERAAGATFVVGVAEVPGLDIVMAGRVLLPSERGTSPNCGCGFDSKAESLSSAPCDDRVPVTTISDGVFIASKICSTTSPRRE